MYQKVPINPGVYKDDTPLTAEGFFIDCDHVRFRRGLPETMGGWELLTSTVISGVCRGITSWADNNTVKWLGLGTHLGLYGVTDSIVYNLTPVASRGTLTNPFDTTISSAVITVNHTSHGLINGQQVSWPSTTVINGATVTATTLYPVAVTSANAFTFTADSAASSSGSGVGGTTYYYYYLAPGLQSSIGALGYGTGVYSTGSTYSAPATGEVYCRTWSLCPYGQNILASPRGGKLYEFAPATSATELVTNGTFTGSATGWTLGAGWAYSSNAAAATLSNAALSQSITTPLNAFCVLIFDVSGFAAGSMQPSFNGVNLGSSISANGRYWVEFFSIGETAALSFTGTGFTGNIDNVSVRQSLSACVVPNAPTQNNCMLVTAEGFVMVGGTINESTSKYDPMLIRWSDIGSKSKGEQIWTPANTNLSSFVRPLIGSRIVAMRQGNNEVLVWTDRALYALTYVGNSSLVYSTRLVGTNCGLIGANAVTVLGGVAYWMSQGSFYMYAGGAPQPVRSGIQKDVFENIALVQEDKIFCGSISGFNDVIWLYPDARDGNNECTRYALLCTQENAPSPPGVNLGPVGVFAPGTFDRTCWADSGVLPYPVAVSTTGQIFYHEKGRSADGGNFSWSLKHGAIQTGNGDTLFIIDTLVPDFKELVGGAQYTAYSYLFPQSTPIAHGPFNVTGATEQVSLMSDAPVGREVIQQFEGSDSPAWMRAGHHMFDLQDTGMAF